MLATIFRTEVAVDTSIQIIRAFVAMRKFISSNLTEQKYINNLVLKNDTDLGNKCFAINKIEDASYLEKIINEIREEKKN